jgi:hypothetical protein
MNKILKLIESYCEKHEITINASKTKCMIFGDRKTRNGTYEIRLDNKILEFVKSFKLLGIWLNNMMTSSDHLKSRRTSTISASYKLLKFGCYNQHMDVNLKCFLVETFCRSRLQYGIENVILTKNDLRSQQSTEAKVLKRALNLSKFSCTTDLLNALEMTSIETVSRMRKLSFLLQLMTNSFTKQIVEALVYDHMNISAKSLISEIKNILCLDTIPTVGWLTSMAQIKVHLLSVAQHEAQNSITARGIRHLLNNQNKINNETLAQLLHWSNNLTSIRKKVSG